MEKTFGKYRIAALIEANSISSVYIARLPKVSDWNMVIKVFDAVLLETSQEQDDFLRKMRVFAQLQHPSILPVLDVGIEKGHPYIVSKYMPGGSLRQRLTRQSPPDITWGIQVISQVGNALRYAHARGIIHNNIKPENIVFDDNDVALLMDFSFPAVQAKLPAASNPAMFSGYYPPAEPASQQSDQYALGSLGYEILFGQLSSIPAALLTAKELHLLEDIPPLAPVDPTAELPLYIDRALRKATSHNPDERYKNVATFINALNAMPETFVESTLSDSTPVVAVSYEHSGVITLDDTVATNIPQGRKHFLESKWMFGAFLAVIVTLILSSFYIFLPALSGKPANHIVSTQIHQNIPIPSVTGNRVIPTPTISTAQQTGKVPGLPLNVVATPIPTPASQVTPTPGATPTPGKTPTPQATPTSGVTPTPQATPTPGVTPTPTPVSTCAVSYVVTHQWAVGFTTNIIISNKSSTAINGWSLAFTFPNHQVITQIWNGNVSQQGSNVTITNVSYNNVISGNGSTSLGFNASWAGSNAYPGSFTLNGLSCSVG